VGKPYDAIDRLRYAIGLRPMYPDAYTKMGVILVGLKQYKDAILYLSQSLKLPPPHFSIVVFNPREYDFEPIRLLAISHYELGLIDDALTYFELCRKIYPKDKELQQLTTRSATPWR
jgi:tetratricopeptide (TPR) repeat protein